MNSLFKIDSSTLLIWPSWILHQNHRFKLKWDDNKRAFLLVRSWSHPNVTPCRRLNIRRSFVMFGQQFLHRIMWKDESLNRQALRSNQKLGEFHPLGLPVCAVIRELYKSVFMPFPPVDFLVLLYPEFATPSTCSHTISPFLFYPDPVNMFLLWKLPCQPWVTDYLSLIMTYVSTRKILIHLPDYQLLLVPCCLLRYQPLLLLLAFATRIWQEGPLSTNHSSKYSATSNFIGSLLQYISVALG
jgi:hypothetical protein